jgi:hypothetical protein
MRRTSGSSRLSKAECPNFKRKSNDKPEKLIYLTKNPWFSPQKFRVSQDYHLNFLRLSCTRKWVDSGEEKKLWAAG